MEQNLQESRVAVEDKEESLAALEQAVQQLAREIAQANSSLAQKEWEVPFLQDWFTDLERHVCKIMNKRWLNGGLFGQCGEGK